MRPLYKGDGKDREDPASYRGIFLSNAMLKLFEGILESRLKVFTEKFDTLTPSQQGSRPGRQRHDAIYSLLAAIQQAEADTAEADAGSYSVVGASYCEFRGLHNSVPISLPRKVANDPEGKWHLGEDVGAAKRKLA